MLNFSKIKIAIIYSLFLVIGFFSLLNFQSEENNIINKKINLGLDLQGGSYLLLEIDTKPLIEERIQDKVIKFKKYLNSKNYEYSNFTINENFLSFSLSQVDAEKFEQEFFSKEENDLNPYIDKYRSFELDLKNSNNKLKINFSKYGLLTLNNSAVKQSIEIVRRRVDDIGTKEPTIIQRGEKRILVELPGLKDPERIKNLLGKTAQLNFRLVSKSNNEFGYETMTSNTGEKLNISKQIIMTGDNLLDAQPRVDNQSSEPIVSFTLDRFGAQKFGNVTTKNVGKRLAIVLDDKVISAPVIERSLPVVVEQYLVILLFKKLLT